MYGNNIHNLRGFKSNVFYLWKVYMTTKKKSCNKRCHEMYSRFKDTKIKMWCNITYVSTQIFLGDKIFCRELRYFALFFSFSKVCVVYTMGDSTIYASKRYINLLHSYIFYPISCLPCFLVFKNRTNNYYNKCKSNCCKHFNIIQEFI